MKKALLLLFVLTCLSFATKAQDYEKMIIGKWKITTMISNGNEISTETLDEVFWMKFTEDKTMVMYFDGNEDSADYEIEGNVITEAGTTTSEKIIVREVTSTNMELDFVSDDEETITMKFIRME